MTKRACLFLTAFIVFALSGLSSCSSSSVGWIPENSREDFQIIGPDFQDETAESYQEIKELNRAISEAVVELKTVSAKDGSYPYQKLQQVNWLLKGKEITKLWNILIPENGEPGELFVDSPLRNRLIDYFETTAFRGRVLAVRISSENKESETQLEGSRLIYLSENEMELNRFTISLQPNRLESFQNLKTILKKLITSLDYSSPGFGRLSFAKVQEGCLKTGLSPEDEECVDEFILGRFPVTRGQWNRMMLKTDDGSTVDGKFPAVGMNWSEIQTFIELLNDASPYSYRLPTGYEWEFACRAGNDSNLFGTANGRLNPNQANYTRFDSGQIPDGVSQITAYPPNTMGFYGLSGNTWEWTEDAYLAAENKGVIGKFFDFFTSNRKQRIIRGGSYDSGEKEIQCNSERLHPENIGAADAGFRLILEE